MKKIALYGYGKWGKRASESYRLFWGGEYEVTAIFDRAQTGITDVFWNLPILDPEFIKEEYERGTFEAIMVCIYNRKIAQPEEEMIEDLGVPLFLPGSAEDLADASAFPHDDTSDISVCRDDYEFHVLKNIFGAVGDFERTQCIFLFDNNGKFCFDNYKKYLEDEEPHMFAFPFRFRDPIPEKIYLKGDWCLIVKNHTTNYWHFTFETLDCVYLLEQAGYKGKYIFKDFRDNKELLLMMGISPDRLVSTQELEGHKVYVFERLFMLNHFKRKCSPEVLPEMAAFFRQKLEKKETYPKKIYVKRIGIRKLLNGEDVAVRNGFSIIIPEEHSLREEMDLFYNADIVISPHGANSTNYLYMDKGTVFIEVLGDRWNVDLNSEVCEANGVHYLRAVGKSVLRQGTGMISDFTIDEQYFEQVIRDAENLLAEEKANQKDGSSFR